jgi:hypothetical protein
MSYKKEKISMEGIILNAILGAFGATLLIVLGFLIKLLWKMSDTQTSQQLEIGKSNILITKIEDREIPTIRIQIEKLDERTDNLEHKQELTDQRVKWLEKEKDNNL